MNDEDILLSDDLMPTDGSMVDYDRTHTSSDDDATKERNMVTAAGPLIETILEWFSEEIALSDSIDGLDLESPIDIKAQILARQLVKEKLTLARERLANMAEHHRQ